MKTYKAILFDLDGTLVDSADLIRLSFNHATRTVLGYELPPAEAIKYMIQPLEDQMRALCENRWQELYAAYMEHNHRWHDRMIGTFEGVPDSLRAFREAGKLLAIVTSKKADTTQMALDVIGLEGLFDQVVTYENTRLHKPDPEPILTCLERLATRPDDAVYVGDSPTDVEAGRAARVDTAAVTWGFFSMCELASAGATYVLERAADLIRLRGDGAEPSLP